MNRRMSQAAEEELAAGTHFHGRYAIVARIGLGATSTVYRARQLSTDQDVALKILTPPRAPDQRAGETLAQRFRREARVCAELRHPNIVRLLDFGADDGGTLFAAFEYVPGTTLRALLEAEGRLVPRAAIHLLAQVLDALACAHKRGVVHRDLKPENIMVTDTGLRRNALVLDFGLSGFAGPDGGWAMPRITATNQMIGTPSYAAPEQLRGEQPTTRSDLYSWGLILLECLTGESAIGGATGPEVVLRQLGPDPVPIPGWLRQQRLGRLIEAVTAKVVEKRTITLEEVMHALDHLGLPGPSAGGESSWATVPEGQRRQVTVVSCRLSVEGDAGSALDVEELDDVMHAQHAIVDAAVQRHDGLVTSVLADRMQIVFGCPRAAEDDAQRALRCALALVTGSRPVRQRLRDERGLRIGVHVGVHTGVVVVRELRSAAQQPRYDLVGVTPLHALRLDACAGSDEVLASGETVSLVRSGVVSTPAGALVPGDPRVVHRVTAPATPGSGSGPVVHDSPLVGREQQLRTLAGLWEGAATGRAAVVLICGEPGIGKSRLVRELRSRVPAGGWLEGRCLPEAVNSPFRPIVELLQSRGDPLAALLDRPAIDDEARQLLLALLAGTVGADQAQRRHSPEREKELTLQAILDLTVSLAHDQPLVCVVEDLHWADPSTLELANLLVQEVTASRADPSGTARLCIVFTARPEFAPPWSLEDVVVIQPPRLDRVQVEALIAGTGAAAAGLPAEVVDEVVRRADGVPLFVEEMARVLRSRNAGDAQRSLTLPATLRGLLAARLDRLSSSARETVQLAAVLGREFRYEELRATAGRDEALLRDDLRELLDVGLLHARRSARAETYVFKHALVRDAAYDTMLRTTCAALHARVAHTLSDCFPDATQQHPEVLGHHLEHAGETLPAASAWLTAGRRARLRAAYVEAIRQIDHALALIAPLPPSVEHQALELDAVVELGTAHMQTKGYQAPEVESCFSRALVLCSRSAREPSLATVNILAGTYLTRGHRDEVERFVPALERWAGRVDDPVHAVCGLGTLAVYDYCRGAFADAVVRYEQMLPVRMRPEYQRFWRAFGQDGSLYAYGYASAALERLGFPERARRVRDAMLADAAVVGDPNSRAVAMVFAGTLAYTQGDVQALSTHAGPLMQLASAQKLYLWMAAAFCAQGGLHLLGGEPEQAVPLVEQGVNLFQAIGVELSYLYHLAYLVRAYREVGRLDEALALADDGIARCRRTVHLFPLGDLLAARGEVLRRSGRRVEAEAALREAVAFARERGARGDELRVSAVLQHADPARAADPAAVG